jgi:hypothetical protein
MDRDYETPHDLAKHTEQGFKASDLTMGSALECRLMIPCPVIRSILQHLTSRCFRGPGSGQVSRQSKDMVEEWMQANRPFLLAFLRFDRVPDNHTKQPPPLTSFTNRWRGLQGSRSGRVYSKRQRQAGESTMSMTDDYDGADAESSKYTYCLSEDASQLLMMWSHYASPAPEILFLPAALHSTVQNIISRQVVTVQEGNTVARLSPGMHRFLAVAKKTLSDADAEDLTHCPDTLTPKALELLQKSLDLSRACLQSGKIAGCMSRPYQAPAQHEFETFLRTGTWAPHNPVIRTLPWFRRDYENYVGTVRRHQVHSQEREEVIQTLRDETKRTGVTCNKYKERHSVLTPGLFTVFCLHCKMCVAWELMEDSESPATAFRMFAHRAWTRQDFQMWRRWKSEQVWEDPCVIAQTAACSQLRSSEEGS